jgi:hypothetical protein
MYRTTFAAALLGLLSAAVVPAHAAEAADAEAPTFAVSALVPANTPIRVVTGPAWIPASGEVQGSTRGGALSGLYASLAALQAVDGYSTIAGVRGGAREANPLMGGAANHAAVMWSVKAGATALSIYTAERLWRQHRRREAIVLMVASNAVMAAVAARNMSVIRGRQ